LFACGRSIQKWFRSRGGLATKILALTDVLGNLVRFVLLPGQRSHTIGVAPPIKGIQFGGLIADPAVDANWIVAEPDERGAKLVIWQQLFWKPRKSSQSQSIKLFTAKGVLQSGSVLNIE